MRPGDAGELILQPGEVVLRIHEVVRSDAASADVLVRSMVGELWRGATVHLTDADNKVVSGPLTVETIWRHERLTADLLDPVSVGKLRLTGPVDRLASAAWVVGSGPPATAVEETAGGYDAELQRHHEILFRAADVQLHDDVLDIGCGAGQTTREAARKAAKGIALGVDVSWPAIQRARELAGAQGLPNIAFELADAQLRRFPPERFDLAISRFGTMFFDDPVVAFTNIARTLRPGGRLVMMVWQAPERNEWDVAIRRSLEVPGEPAGPGPFSFADPLTVREILQTAGLADIAFTDVHEPVFYGPDVAAALDWVHSFTCTSEALKKLDPAAAKRADEGLRQTLAAHLGDDGVWFDSRAWIVTARR
jgi:SAM-dependent methyltransferase